MPSILVHYSFAKEVIPESAKGNEDVVYLGTQGPDVFMAYGTDPFRKEPNVSHVQPFGGFMHRINIAETYGKMMKYANESPDKEMLYSYIEGILMHYTLDRAVHPYVFAETGFDKKGQLTGFYKWSHSAYEMILDVAFSKKKKTFMSPAKALLADEGKVKKISTMWKECAPYTLEDDSFYRSYKDYVGVEKILYSHTGFRRLFFRLFAGKWSTPMAMSLPKSIKKYEEMDIFNEAHRTWRDPSTLAENHTSFEEIFNGAKEDFQTVLALIEKAKTGEDVTEGLRKWTRDIDHDGSPIGVRKTVHSLCWKRVKGFKFPKGFAE